MTGREEMMLGIAFALSVFNLVVIAISLVIAITFLRAIK